MFFITLACCDSHLHVSVELSPSAYTYTHTHTDLSLNKTSTATVSCIWNHKCPPIHPGLDCADLYAASHLTAPHYSSSVGANKPTLPPPDCIQAARRGARGLHNWFVEHTSCFMWPVCRSLKEVQAEQGWGVEELPHGPHPPLLLSSWIKGCCQIDK